MMFKFNKSEVIVRNVYLFRLAILTVFVVCGVGILHAEVEPAPQGAPRPIQDNSFLIEEAYNQEDGVVQHIQTFTRMWPSRSWAYTFTEEFPIRGIKNQLSYMVQASHSGDYPDAGSGFGDVAFNYRYQLVGSGDTRLAIAPRFTVLAPSGDATMGRGAGGAGIQAMIPVSFELNRYLVAHSNVGVTWTPRARNAIGDRAATNGYALGQSLVWLAKPRFNVLVEALWTGSESVVSPDRTQRAHDLLISPGIRWAHNFKSGLQIVPGIAMPIGAGPGSGEKGVFVYLSFEHPWNAFKK